MRFVTATMNQHEDQAHERGKGTKAALLKVTMQILDEVGEANVRLEEILRRASASPSSLYHHFGNLRGLVEEAQAERFAGIALRRTEEFAAQIDSLDSREKFAGAADYWISEIVAPEYTMIRRARADALGSAFSNAEFAARIGASLSDAHRRLADILEASPNRRFLRPDFDAYTFAAMFDGMLFSRVLIELGDDESLGASWNRAVRELIFVLLFGDDARELLDHID